MHVEDTDLLARRLAAVRAWTAFVEHGDGAQTLVRPEIYSSWERSDASITPNVRHAPLADEADTRAFWTGSPLQIAVSRVEEELRRTAEDGDLVLAVTDADTRILWTYGGRVMRRKAESVNFVAGGRWDDRERRHQRPRPGQPDGSTVDGVLGRALRLDRAQLGVLGSARQRPRHGTPAGCHRPVDHVGPHPPDRPGDRPGDGEADRAGDAALARAPRSSVGRRGRPTSTASRCGCSAPPRPTSTVSGCC